MVSFRLVDGHQINLRAGLVPESLNSMSNRKISNPLAATLLVELAGEFFQGPSLDISQALIGLFNQVAERPKRYCRYRIRQGRKPRTEKIVGHVVAASLRFRLGEHRQFPLDQSESLDQHLQVAANLSVGTPACLSNRLHEFVVHPSRIAGHELQDYVVPASQFTQKPVLGLGSKRR